MQTEGKIAEGILHQVWKNQSYHNHLKTLSGEDIEILDSGVLNDSTSGPDFKNARLRIGNFTFVGDIEIDSDYTDWKSHGHNIDIKYSKVILHATLFNKNNYAYVFTKDGRKIPSISLSNFVEKEVLISLQEQNTNDDHPNSHLKCSSLIENVPLDFKNNTIEKLSLERFEKKCKKVLDRLKELKYVSELNIKEPAINYDLTQKFHDRKFTHTDFDNKEIWQQLLLELLFEALGYSKNKSQMMNLAKLANVEFLNKIEHDGVLVSKYEAALFKIAGLVHDESSIKDNDTKEYVELLNIHWNSIKHNYDSKFMDETEWHFFRLRPQNFPTVRIAGGARLTKAVLHENLIGAVTKKINEIHNLTVLINSLRSLFVIKGDGFWKTHFVMDQPANSEIKYFIGASRADEIIVNVILPVFAVYFEVFGKPVISKKVFKLYHLYEQKSENQIIVDVAKALSMENQAKRTIYAQGMIELFRNYCSKNKCLECEIGKIVFN